MADTNFISKLTTITAKWLNQINRYAYGVSSVAGIRSLDSTIYTRARTLGFYAPGDGSPADYYTDPADTTSGDNGFQCLIAADGMRWKLVYGTVLNDRQAGVKADGSTDDTVAHQNAINYVENTYDPATYASTSPYRGTCTLYHGAGYSLISGSPLAQTKKVSHIGDGPAERSSGTRIQQSTTNVDLFQLAAIAQGASTSFEKMTLVGNGLGGSGSLIHVKPGVSGAAFNSQRYFDMVWAQPGGAATNIELGDDIMFRNCLTDVASGTVHIYGSSTTAATNAQHFSDKWFDVQTRVFLLINVDGLLIDNPIIYASPTGAITSTQWFLDGVNGIPVQIKNVTVTGGNTKAVQVIAQLNNAVAFKMMGGNYQNCGNGVSSTISALAFTGTCDQISLIGNTFQGNMGAMSFYDDTGGTVTNANIVGNIFNCSAGMTGSPFKCAGTSGVIGLNYFPGWTGTPVVSQQFFTSGSAINPGAITAGSAYTFTATVTGAKQGDKVTATPSSTADPIPQGIVTRAWVSAANTISFKLMNLTSGTITPSAFDYGFLVTRG